MSEKKTDPQKCVTPMFRVSFPEVYKAKAYKDEKEPKFKLTMLFAKNADLSVMRKAVFAAKKAKFGPDKTKWPKMGANPVFRDGNDKSDLDGYKDTIFVVAKNKHRPKVIGPKFEDGEPVELTEESREFYAGCYARASLRAFVYGGPGTPYKPGVSFSLESIQKLKDGEPFDGRQAPGDVFDEVDSGEDDEDNYEDGDEEGDDEEGGF